MPPNADVQMMYLVLAADYIEPSIRTELASSTDQTEVDLPDSLLDDLSAWNVEYQQIIPLEISQRSSVRASSTYSTARVWS